MGSGGSTQSKRPSVQVGDPFAEKLLIEASLELIERGLVEGLQDLGAGGITCATSETADRAGTGIRVDLDAIPRREPDMAPFEVMISESQERMCAAVGPERWDEVREVCERWGLPVAVIGRVTDDAARATGLIAGTPVVMGGGDGPMGALGAGIIAPESGAYAYLGSSSWVSVAADAPTQERADTSKPGHVAAPFDGVVSVVVSEGDTVEAGATVATIEAMKMEASITAPVAGTVSRLAVPATQAVEGGDLVLVISPR